MLQPMVLMVDTGT